MKPHEGGSVMLAGASLDGARGAAILVHGRGASPANILELVPAIDRPDIAYLAPGAVGGTWYPNSFMAERESNEPGISSGLGVIAGLVDMLMARGFESRHILLLGFSQGACLSSEFAIRHPRRYAGVMVLSGGLIGPPGTSWDDVSGDFGGTPVFLGCSDIDAHIPAARVIESEAVFRRLGAEVARVLYSGMGHLVNDDEIVRVQRAIDAIVPRVHSA
ncbi:MAG: alpha/beta hydrolase [Gemmatimonadales bacterium]